MYVLVYVGVSAAMCVRTHRFLRVPTCVYVQSRGGGGVSACVCVCARDLFS